MSHHLSTHSDDPRQIPINRLIALIHSKPELQFAVRQIQTLQDLLAFSRRVGTPIEEIDIVVYYRDLNEDFWPWHGMSKQARRYFVHERRMPECDPDAPDGRLT